MKGEQNEGMEGRVCRHVQHVAHLVLTASCPTSCGHPPTPSSPPVTVTLMASVAPSVKTAVPALVKGGSTRLCGGRSEERVLGMSGSACHP